MSSFCLVALVIHLVHLTSPELFPVLYFYLVSSGLQAPYCHFYLLKSFASLGRFAQMPFPPRGLLQRPQREIIILSSLLQWYIVHCILKDELAYAFHYSFVCVSFFLTECPLLEGRTHSGLISASPGRTGTVPFICHTFCIRYFELNCRIYFPTLTPTSP